MSHVRVLSIQSHVVSGYVGNKCATFPLQRAVAIGGVSSCRRGNLIKIKLLGIEVDFINSVQLSNHTGYSVHPGQVLDSAQLEQLVDGLIANGIFNYSHIITGYAGNVGFLNQVVDVITEAKLLLPNMLYVCDPVMGDNGAMYVPKEMLSIYRNKLLPLANILTPNQFEAELLSGVSIESEADAVQAMTALHNKHGASTVIITGTNLAIANGMLAGFVSDRINRWRFDVPFIEGCFTGTGDLFTSVLTGWMAKGYELKESVERALSTVQHVLQRTVDLGRSNCGDGSTMSSTMDVQVVKSKVDIENPKLIVKLKKLREIY